MSSYYKKINGKNYDRIMLEVADKSAEDKGDGKISLSDAKTIISKTTDGGRITDIELRTLNYILEKYKFTEPALKYIEESLSDDLILKDKEISDHTKPEHIQKESQKESQKEAPKESQKESQKESFKENQKENKPLAQKKESKTSKIKYLILFFCILIMLAAFLLFNFFCKKDTALTEKNEEIKPALNNEEKVDKTIDKTNDENAKSNAESDKNEYVVKQYDTLIKISQAVYGDYRFWKDIYKANNDKIKNPAIIYPGQVLKIPEKNR